MKTNKKNLKIKLLFKEETKQHSLIRYFLLILFLLAYLIYTSYKFGSGNGLLITALTWSFFVFCTPIADAGFILALPIRLLIGVRMVYTQIFSYLLAFLINIITLIYTPTIYNKTLLLNLYHQILTKAFPYWGIIILSFVGTFFSIYFGDELIDVTAHKERTKYHRHINKYKFIVFVFTMVATIIFYNFLLHKLNINIPLL